MLECFNVGMSGGCGPECYIYLEGRCGEPQEMLPRLDAQRLAMHSDLYPDNEKDLAPRAREALIMIADESANLAHAERMADRALKQTAPKP